MIYICYIKYKMSVATCMLTVRNNELSVRDNEDTSPEAAEGCGMHMRTLRDHIVGLGLVMWHGR
jgi:hypothetical protein